MSVTNNVLLGVQLLRCGEIIRIGVDEMSGLEMLETHLDLEGGVRLDRAQILRMDELGRGHVGRRSDDTHRRGIAGTPLDLLAVREGLVDRQAKVDKVVRGGQGWGLSRRRVSLPILFEVRADDPIVQR